MNATSGRLQSLVGAEERGFQIAYELVKDADFDDRYGPYAGRYAGPIRVLYAGRVDVVMTENYRIDVWLRERAKRLSVRVATFTRRPDGSARIISIKKDRLQEWLAILEARANSPARLLAKYGARS